MICCDRELVIIVGAATLGTESPGAEELLPCEFEGVIGDAKCRGALSEVEVSGEGSPEEDCESRIRSWWGRGTRWGLPRGYDWDEVLGEI